MTIELITGTPGAGKTTYAVAERLVAEVGREIHWEYQGQARSATRRLVVAGVRGLVVEHERIPHTLTGEVTSRKVIEYFNAVDQDDEPLHKRLPEDAPLEIPAELTIEGKKYAAGASLFNWWMWCRPGDLIVVDEIQYITPRGVLGRKPPPWIALLEIHRHYGVDFLIITQHPQLIDTVIRNLVGMHRHVRSVMGSPLCMIYAWDHASNTDRLSNATKSKFFRRAKHYRLFTSAAAHVAPPRVGRWVLWMLPLLIVLAWFLAQRVITKHDTRSAASASASPVASAPAQGAAFGGLSFGGMSTAPRSAQATDRTWPAYVAEPVKLQREPLDGRAVQWEGSYGEPGASLMVLFGLYIDGERVATVTLRDLNAMGYRWVDKGPCVGMLQFGQLERLVTCGKKPSREAPPPVTAAAAAVRAPASSPAA